METLSYLMFNLAFVIIFAIMGLLTLTMHMPKDEEFIGYRKARYTLGIGFVIMSLYCVFRLVVPQKEGEYMQFWLLTVVSLLFSWLNYTAFLFLIDSEYKVRHHFFIDGISPLVLMIISGVAGIFVPSIQGVVINLLGIIFLAKCVWMFYICNREWRKVNEELQNSYDESPDIGWMRRLLWLTLFLSVGTLLAWYIPKVHFVFDIVAPMTYVYMVLKLVNYSPKKIDEMRVEALSGNSNTEKKTIPEVKSLYGMVEKKLSVWVDNKNYCKANLSIKDVALEIGTNHNYLSKYLNGCLNVSFQVWLNTLRIEESKEILVSENISIEEVGARVGIPLSYNYSRWFKTVTGETPFRYRQNAVRRAL